MQTTDYTVIVTDRTRIPYFWKVPGCSIQDARVTAEGSDPGIEVICVSKKQITNQTKREVTAYAS